MLLCRDPRPRLCASSPPFRLYLQGSRLHLLFQTPHFVPALKRALARRHASIIRFLPRPSSRSIASPRLAPPIAFLAASTFRRIPMPFRRPSSFHSLSSGLRSLPIHIAMYRRPPSNVMRSGPPYERGHCAQLPALFLSACASCQRLVKPVVLILPRTKT